MGWLKDFTDVFRHRDYDELRGAMSAWNSHLDIADSPQIFPN